MSQNGSLPDEPSDRSLLGPVRAREIDLSIARRLAAEHGMTLVPRHMIETVHAEVSVATVSLLQLDKPESLRHHLTGRLAHEIGRELHRSDKLTITETSEEDGKTLFHACLTLILPDKPREA